ncbi:MAG: isochorismatase family cysteine hydrolase [Deferribacterota bacterium]|nr:isochorismatase family cysteine hydrolase [Deferribacterota bacterium]
MFDGLIIIDMLNDFLLEGAPLYLPSGRLIINNIKKEIDYSRERNIPVIYVCDSHLENDLEFKVWPKHCIKNSFGSKVVDELSPLDNDLIIEKNRYSSFYNTDLDELLKKMDIKTINIAGILTNVCVLYTVADAHFRDYNIVVKKNCVATNDRELENFAFRQMKEIHNVDLVDEK